MPWWRRDPPKPAEPESLSRRDFFRRFGGGAADNIRPAEEPPTRRPPASPTLPQRPLGRTGLMLPILGFGTARLGRTREPESAAALLHEAIELGVTFIDTGSEKGGYGAAQRIVGEVMRQRRSQVFLSTKIFEPDGSAGRRMLERALEELQTDHVELLHAHSLGHAHMDPAVVFGPNGVFRMLLQARAEGLCRFIGATCHNQSARVLRALAEYDLDAVMMPANFVDAHTYGFEGHVWPVAREKGCGLIAMKVFAGPAEGVDTPALMPRQFQDLAYRYALSLDGCASAVVGMLDRRELHENVLRARTFQPLAGHERARVDEVAPALAATWGQHLGDEE